MARFGAFLALIGFGSALLHFTDIQFTLVIWAEPMQPFLGLGVGGVGALILLIVMASRKEPEAQPAGPQPVAYQPPVAQPYGPPPGSQPLPRRVPHQPFAQQPPREMPPQGPPPPQGPWPPQYRPRTGPHSPPGGPAPFGPGGQFGQHR